MNKSLQKSLWMLVMSALFAATQSIAQWDFSLVGFGAATTGGAGGSEVTVTSVSQLSSEAGSSGKKIIKIGQTLEASGTIIEVANDKTIIGIGDQAFLKGIGFHMKNVSNVIIRNIKFTMIGGGAEDVIGAETTSDNTGGNYWIDHCEFYNEYPTLPETAAKKDKYDGLCDFKKQVANITISWCYFHDHWKCSLIGFSTDKDPYDRKITYHHNWFQNIKSRTPSYRAGTAHIYNNFFDGLNDPNAPSSEGVHTRDAACLRVEGNYFQNYNKSVYWYVDDSPTEAFVDETGVPNKYVNSPSNTAGSCTFNPPYTVNIEAAEDVPSIVKIGAGIGKLEGVPIMNAGEKYDSRFRIYMFGSTARVTLPSDDASVITVFDVSGCKMMEKTVKSYKANVNMSTMSSGIYLITVALKSETMQKLIVKK